MSLNGLPLTSTAYLKPSKASSGGRMLIARGLLVRAFAVYGLLIDDDAIELIGIDLDLDP